MMNFILTVDGVVIGTIAVIVIFANISRITDFFRNIK